MVTQAITCTGKHNTKLTAKSIKRCKKTPKYNNILSTQMHTNVILTNKRWTHAQSNISLKTLCLKRNIVLLS